MARCAMAICGPRSLNSASSAQLERLASSARFISSIVSYVERRSWMAGIRPGAPGSVAKWRLRSPWSLCQLSPQYSSLSK
jgi:hypothetical protein